MGQLENNRARRLKLIAYIATTVLLTSSVNVAGNAYLWRGYESAFLSYERLVTELHGVNPEMATEQLRRKILFAIKQLQEVSLRKGDVGAYAKNTLNHFKAQLDKQ